MNFFRFTISPCSDFQYKLCPSSRTFLANSTWMCSSGLSQQLTGRQSWKILHVHVSTYLNHLDRNPVLLKCFGVQRCLKQCQQSLRVATACVSSAKGNTSRHVIKPFIILVFAFRCRGPVVMMQWFTNAHQLCQPKALHLVQEHIQNNDIEHVRSPLSPLYAFFILHFTSFVM